VERGRRRGAEVHARARIMILSCRTLVLLVGATEAILPARYDCAACLLLEQYGTHHCDVLDACHLSGPAGGGRCVEDAICDRVVHAEPSVAASPINLRVTKGVGTRPYASLRVSIVTNTTEPTPWISFDYSAAFAHRWTSNTLHSSIVNATPGTRMRLPYGPNASEFASLWLPEQGSGVAGVLIADPCVRLGSVTAMVACNHAKEFQTLERTPALLNAFLQHDDTDYWGVLGDNWYDREGDITAAIYRRLALPTLQKIAISVAGNHDYWLLGSPGRSVGVLDQFGNGHMQWYAMDTLAARDATPGTPAPPFNTSIVPWSKGERVFGGHLPDVRNSQSYFQIGNVGVASFSGAYSPSQIRKFLEEACAWFPIQSGLRLGVLMGHWDKPNMGAVRGADAPSVYDVAKTLPGCRELDAIDALKYVAGHTHCNIPHPHARFSHGHPSGFMVAGQGMEADGCRGGANYGIPVLDTANERARFWYFAIAEASNRSVDNYDVVLACVQAKGWRGCTEHATLWLDQPLPPPLATLPSPPARPNR